MRRDAPAVPGLLPLKHRSWALGAWEPAMGPWGAKAKAKARGALLLLLLLLLLGLPGAPSRSLLSFPGPISNLASSGGRLLVASGNCWYEVEPSLARKAEGHCQKEEDAVNKLLLPFGGDEEEEDGGDGGGWRVLTCWTQPGCACFLQGFGASRGGLAPPREFGRELVSSFPGASDAGRMYFSRGAQEWLLMVAASHQRRGSRSTCGGGAAPVAESTARTAVSLKGERGRRVSEEQALFLAGENALDFGGAFQWRGLFFFPYSHHNRSLEPKMLVIARDRDEDQDQDQVRPRGQKALRCGGRRALLASAFLRPRGLWAGLFGGQGQEEEEGHGQGAPGATALCLFPLERLLQKLGGCSLDGAAEFEKIAWPFNNSTSLTHSSLVSVYATAVLNKTVLFLGTRNGQLLKVILDDNMKSNCPEILYEIEEESPVFHKLELDPVNEDYLYLPSNNEIRRIQVANCSKYVSCKECLSAFDPHCGWCHLKNSCTLKGECPFSNKSMNWTSISYGTDKCLKIYTSNPDRGEISVTASGDSLDVSEGPSTCTMINARTRNVLCKKKNPGINCSCQLEIADLTDKVKISVSSGSWYLTEILEFNECSSQKTCSECKQLGCSWDARENRCVVSTVTCKRKVNCDEIISAPNRKDTLQRSKPMSITSIQPAWIPTLGKNEVLVIGENFTGSNILMEITGASSCKPVDGGRNIIIRGRYLNITDSVFILDEMEQALTHFTCHTNSVECNFTTPTVKPEKRIKMAPIVLEVEKRHVPCIKLQYDPDPEFIHYELTTDLEPDLELKIHKKKDQLNISRSEIEIFLSHMAKNELVNITFTVQNISNSATRSIIHSRAKREKNSGSKIDRSTVKVYVKVGNFVQEVPNETRNYSYLYILFLIIPIVIVGFVELQMEKLDVVDSFGTIPFLDYKHFVLRTFFPEPGGNALIFIEDSNRPLSRSPSQKDESITELSKLICNKKFLVTLIHTLEKQKTFSVKDRCLFASFLTIALQTNLVYLTDILEVLTRDLMDQSSNIQPKLMLRRTESVVEKLLTNWMSVCLSGFLRAKFLVGTVQVSSTESALETVGEPFYMLVTTLNQKMIKGPVDVITCKALYTLNEDWLLWQVTEFNTVALNVIFENIQENEDEGTIQNIQVNVLDCDTIGQVKEKILQAFLNKNGSLYGLQLSEMGLALQSGVYVKELLDVDSSSVILEGGITKLNTISHYEISDGATIKVFKKEETVISGCSDGEYSDNYCHLILPDSEAAKDTQSANHKGKQKFKVKEMYLTKLLSTKVAVHSVVEKFFRSIWTLPNNKAPIAIKYFFDFLDAQAENKKITDPDEAPTNKLLYAKDIPFYKEEVKAFYKAIRDLPPLSTSEIEDFLTQESKKHENEFNEAVALIKIYQYIARYFDEILNKLEKERGLEEAQQQLLNIKSLVEEKKKCKWI
ncbi:hypothetical protein JD844_028118 [Phrynosoma platyrhinos]|uniref:PSI domain-containing protein n=1 Tax=Phrynosoma platyrhinos TaxID=52577 RepID=A0ABQ7SHJ4_PHRPL|nr:hypothetical protein JD844_028118 [Phrynosoma platyrhinos]